jgi:hypothetical protein
MKPPAPLVIDANVLSRTVLDAVPGLSPSVPNGAEPDIPVSPDSGPETTLPDPAVAEKPGASSIALQDAEAEVQAKRQQTRMFLYAIGGVGTVVGTFLLIAALTSRSPASKRPHGEPPPDQPYANSQFKEDPARLPGRDSHAKGDDEADVRVPDRRGQDWPPVRQTPASDSKDDSTGRARLVPGTGPWETKLRDKPPTGQSTPSRGEPPVEPPPETKPGDTKPSTSQPSEQDKVLAEARKWVKLLEARDSEELQLKALDELGKKGPAVKDVAGKAVAKCMLDRATSPRSNSITTLGRKAKAALEKIDPAVAEECTAIIVSPEGRLRSIETLGRLGEAAKSATPILLWVIDHNAIGTTIQNPVQGQLQPQKPLQAPIEALRALVAIAPDDARLLDSCLKWMKQTRDEDAREALIESLPRLKLDSANKKEAVLLLDKELRDGSTRTKIAAARTLGEWGKDSAAAKRSLEAATTDGSENVRKTAKDALSKITSGS